MLQRILFTTSGKFRLAVVVLISFIVTFLGIIPGFTLTGLVFLFIPGSTVLDFLLRLFGYPSIESTLQGDAIFTYTFPLSLSLFPLLVLDYLIAFRLFSSLKKWKQWILWIGFFFGWAILSTLTLYLLIHIGYLELPVPLNDQLQELIQQGSTQTGSGLAR